MLVVVLRGMEMVGQYDADNGGWVSLSIKLLFVFPVLLGVQRSEAN